MWFRIRGIKNAVNIVRQLSLTKIEGICVDNPEVFYIWLWPIKRMGYCSGQLEFNVSLLELWALWTYYCQVIRFSTIEACKGFSGPSGIHSFLLSVLGLVILTTACFSVLLSYFRARVHLV